jgi:hypothetical protein
MERTSRLHRLYAAAAIAIWIEATVGLLWLIVGRRREVSS